MRLFIVLTHISGGDMVHFSRTTHIGRVTEDGMKVLLLTCGEPGNKSNVYQALANALSLRNVICETLDVSAILGPVSDAERALCIGNFVSARRDGLEARDQAKRFMAYANTAASEFLYDMLWRISRVDGTVDPAEDRLLEEIALYLGLSKTIYENFKAGKKPSHDKGALKAAGVPPSLVALAR